MSIAGSYVNSFKRTMDKKLIRLRIARKAVRIQVTTDGTISYFTDDSALIDRRIINELQLFRG